MTADEWRDWSACPKRSFDAWANAYIHHFSRRHPDYSVRVLRDALDRQPGDTAVVERIARDTGLSVRTLRRNFEKLTGMTARSYQGRRRVERAIALLEHTDGKVQAIANDLGWASRKDLLNALRDATGLTPSQIRKGCHGATTNRMV